MSSVSTKIVGIDPGRSGALVVMTSTQKIEEVYHMPEDEDRLLELLRDLCERVDRAFIEAIPKFAGENRSAAFMAVLYGNFKFVSGAIRMHGGVELIELPLLKWMNATIPMRERSRERTERKRQLLERARLTWPDHKWTMQTCDAALIGRAGLILQG